MSEKRPEAAHERRRREKIERQLDEALEGSFPASDPVSIVTSIEEEDWGGEEGDSGEESPATEPSAPASSPPDSRS
jgi:hypothetical protein